MENVRKMILLPHETAEKLNPTTPIIGTGGVMTKLDQDMGLILHEKNVSDEEKWRKYSAALGKYMHYLAEAQKTSFTPHRHTRRITAAEGQRRRKFSRRKRPSSCELVACGAREIQKHGCDHL